MKIYRFNIENCLYLGEDFCLPDDLQDEDGVTTVAPPAPVADTVPVFDPSSGQWSLVSLNSLGKSVKRSWPT